MVTINSSGPERELSDAFRKLTFLPASAAVKGPMVQAQIQQPPPFTDADHERSRIVREVLDSFDGPPLIQAKRVEAQVPHERISLEGSLITNTIAIAGKVVKQTRRHAVMVDPELALIAAQGVAQLPDHRLARLAKESDQALDAALKRLAADQIHDRPKRKAPIRRSLLARIFGSMLATAS